MLRLRPAARAATGVVPQLGLTLCLLLAGLAAPLPAGAAGPVSIPQGPIPVDEELKPVEFSYISLDVTMNASEDGLSIDTVTRTRLRNPQKKEAFERQVTFPGVPASGIRIGTQNGGLSAVGNADTYVLSLRADGDAVIQGTQRVATEGAVIDLTFDWGKLGIWGSPLGAARLTLHFPADLHSEQLLQIDPEPTDRSTVQLTWSYEKFDPTGQVHVVFINPVYWRPVMQARQAASKPGATADDHMALATALQPLIDAEGMPAPVVEALQAELLAALRQAVAADPNATQAHSALAAYLRTHAKGDPALLSEAVSELKAAYDLAPSDAEIKSQLAAGLDELMAACRESGDRRGLLSALDIAEQLSPENSQERSAAYADLAVSLLDEGRTTEAEDTIVAGFGQGALDRYAYYRPHFSLVAAEVQTVLGQRVLRFSLVPAPGAEAEAESDLAALNDALNRMSGAQVQTTTDGSRTRIEIVIPFDSPEALQAAGEPLVGALPDDADPALQLVLAVAHPATVGFGTSKEVQSDLLSYAEAADLTQADAALQRRLSGLESARMEAAAETSDPVEAARRRWVLALLDHYQAGWQAMVDSCQVTYRLLPPENIVAPDWTLAWGESHSLAWSTQIPHLERLKPYAIGAGAAIVAILAIVIVVSSVRRRRATAES